MKNNTVTAILEYAKTLAAVLARYASRNQNYNQK